MPYKDKETRNARQRAKYAERLANDPEWVAKKAEKAAEYYRKKIAEDEAYKAKRKEDFAKWYAEHGKENARERKGYKPLEEYLAECEARRKSKSEYMKQWYQTGKGRRARVARSIKERCGLSIDDYDRIYDEQEGTCKICGKHKERYAKDRLVVDHCHTTGNFRALLCSNCNSAIGLLGESEEIMTNAINYLRAIRDTGA